MHGRDFGIRGSAHGPSACHELGSTPSLAAGNAARKRTIYKLFENPLPKERQKLLRLHAIHHFSRYAPGVRADRPGAVRVAPEASFGGMARGGAEPARGTLTAAQARGNSAASEVCSLL